MSGIDISRLIRIKLNKGPVNGSEVGVVLILGEGELDVINELVDLGVELDSEEGHGIIDQASFIYITAFIL